MASYEYDSQNQKLNRIAGGTLYADMPIGSEIEYAGTTAPTGFLECDGSTYSQIIYPELYAILGTTTLPSKSGYIIKAKQIGVPADFASAIEDVIDEKFSYSTSEKKTGRKWIDGKDTYTITFNALLSSDNLDVAHNIANIDKVINTSGFLGSDGSCLPSGLYVSPSYFISMFSDRTQYHIRTVSAYLNFAYNITLEYTKTTD